MIPANKIIKEGKKSLRSRRLVEPFGAVLASFRGDYRRGGCVRRIAEIAGRPVKQQNPD